MLHVSRIDLVVSSIHAGSINVSTRSLAIRWNTPTKLSMISFFSGLYFYLPIMTLYFQQRGLNLFEIGTLWSITTATTLLAEIPTGILADRIGRKRSVNMALFLQASGEVAFLYAHTYWAFAGIAALAGLGFSFASGAMEALVYDSLPPVNRPEQMQQAMGTIGASRRAADIIAFMAGGIIVANLEAKQFTIAVAATALAVGIAFLLSFSLHEPQLISSRREVSSLHV